MIRYYKANDNPDNAITEYASKFGHGIAYLDIFSKTNMHNHMRAMTTAFNTVGCVNIKYYPPRRELYGVSSEEGWSRVRYHRDRPESRRVIILLLHNNAVISQQYPPWHHTYMCLGIPWTFCPNTTPHTIDSNIVIFCQYLDSLCNVSVRKKLFIYTHV